MATPAPAPGPNPAYPQGVPGSQPQPQQDQGQQQDQGVAQLPGGIITADVVMKIMGWSPTDSEKKALAQELADALNKVPLAQRAAYFDQARQRIQDASTGAAVRGGLSQVFRNPLSAPQQPPDELPQIVHSVVGGLNAATQGGQEGPQDPTKAGQTGQAGSTQPIDPAAPLTDDEWAQLSQILGTDAKAAYQSFNQNNTIGIYQPPTPLSPLTNAGAAPGAPNPAGNVGQPQNPTQPQAPRPPSQETAVPASPRTTTTAGPGVHDVEGTFTGQQSQQQVRPGMSPRQFLEFVMTSTYGIAGQLAQAAADNYRQAYGTEMPADLKAQILAYFQSQPDDAKQKLVTDLQRQPGGTGGSAAQALVGGYAPITNIVNSYRVAHPSAQEFQATADANHATAIENALNRPAKPEELAAARSMDDASFNHYIDTLIVPQYGVAYGVVRNTLATLDPIYRNTFGKEPPKDVVAWAMGKSQDEIQGHINSMPAKDDPSLTVGTYANIKGFLDKNWGSFFGYSAGPSEVAGATSHLFG